jgi:uncharacterized protein (TIGR02145 family)/prepilin-type N-terminal cleavage/methylation domain-containing protein
MKGFSLLEVIIVMGILAIIAAASSGFYINYNKSFQIKASVSDIIFDLKQAQSNSMIGAGGLKWGIHFVNGVTDYYEIFSTPTDYSNVSKVVTVTKYLPKGITFSDTDIIGTKDIIFNKITGGTTTSSIAIISSETLKTISISSIGNIIEGGILCDGTGTVFTCGNSCEYNGSTYPTIQIGNQCWFAENLKTLTYPNGSAVTKGPAAQASGGWYVFNTSYYSCPPNSSNTDEDCAAATDSNNLGYMYQWNTTMNGTAAVATGAGPQGICPAGWQVPTDDNTASSGWGELFSYVGTLPGCSGKVGSCLAIGGSTGFNALFAGNRSSAGVYNSRGTWFNIQSSSEGTTNTRSWSRRLYVTNVQLARAEEWKTLGFSVRCLKNN